MSFGDSIDEGQRFSLVALISRKMEAYGSSRLVFLSPFMKGQSIAIHKMNERSARVCPNNISGCGYPNEINVHVGLPFPPQ